MLQILHFLEISSYTKENYNAFFKVVKPCNFSSGTQQSQKQSDYGISW
ncbi:hypothetical protein NC653_019565 [Populus alba x Populus x berolinensis]|uniref:Uncharacterized protein n=1 Tax=Populus alba x Populus x berolinensis TaxID=444605 RepID=A0AAD6VXU9_9ROSI|nr:hypothetical protein NC653_019565 [Populus alba x Populus x berolinensis]